MTDASTQTDVHEIEGTENSISTSDNTYDNDNQAERLDWRSFCQYLGIVNFLNILVMYNCLFVFYLCFIGEFQLSAWKTNLINARHYNIVHERQYFQMRRLINIYYFVTMFISFVFILHNMTLRIIIKKITEMRWQIWAFIYIYSFILSTILMKEICLRSDIQTCVQNIYQEIIERTTIKIDPFSISAEDYYLILTYPKALLWLKYTFFLCNVEHLIIIMLLIAHRPADYQECMDELEDD